MKSIIQGHIRSIGQKIVNFVVLPNVFHPVMPNCVGWLAAYSKKEKYSQRCSS